MGSRLSGDGGLVTSGLLRDYQQQQGAGLAQPLLAEVMRQLTTMALPKAWAAELSADRSANAAGRRRHRLSLLAPPRPPDAGHERGGHRRGNRRGGFRDVA